MLFVYVYLYLCCTDPHSSQGSSVYTRESQKGASSSEILRLDTGEGTITAVNHFNSDVASVVTYLTQQGRLHGLDLRCSKEAFQYVIRPELGQPTV